MAKQQYSPEELYKGYYWLILHTDPNVLVSSAGERVPQIIPEFKFKYPMPDCVKTAIGAKTVMHIHSREELDRLNKGLTNDSPFYTSPGPYSTYEIDDIFAWLLQDKVPTLKLRASDKEIKSWEDLRELWKEADIPFQDLRDGYTFGTKVKISVPVPYEDQYSKGYFYGLESHLARQHQENLKRLAQPVRGKGIKKFFRNPWKLAGVIIAFISMIFGILQFLVMKK